MLRQSLCRHPLSSSCYSRPRSSRRWAVTVVGAKPPNKQSNSNTNARVSSNGLLRPIWRRVTGATKTTLALIGLGATLYAINDIQYLLNNANEENENSNDTSSSSSKSSFLTTTTKKKMKNKRVLVIPFHRMKLIETNKTSLPSSILNSFTTDGSNGDDRVREIPVHDLIDAIHAAAKDDSIVALYGKFGSSSSLSQCGMAHLEQVRQALQTFRETPLSKRQRQQQPTQHHNSDDKNDNTVSDDDPSETNKHKQRTKPMYAYADTLAGLADTNNNKEYYLASIFTHLHLQQQGELNLSGMAVRNTFWKQFLQQNGIQVHVFKHGKYKNAPNTFTESSYTREHKQNVTNVMTGIEQYMQQQIINARFSNDGSVHDNIIWKLLKRHGTMVASEAQAMGFVDYTTLLCPLEALLKHNKDKQKAKKENKKITDGGADESHKTSNPDQPKLVGVDFETFEAIEPISLRAYHKQLTKRKSIETKQWKWHDRLRRVAESSSAAQAVLSTMGYSAPNFNIPIHKYSKERQEKQKIAVLYVTGAINDSVAMKTVKSLRQIRNDDSIRCVILRVDSPGGSVTASETILQETKAMPQPVICSMGNVAASGGYYIATGCERIFASPTTMTGSIGVFGIKLDLSGLAKRYGITSSSVSTGPHAGAYDVLQPMTRAIRMNLSKNVDRYYDYFKTIVSQSRQLDMKKVESLAQGRVWTGEQAKASGLVDELGGLHQAIAFAKQTYGNPDTIVETWPRRESFEGWVKKMFQDGVFVAFGGDGGLLDLMYGSRAMGCCRLDEMNDEKEKIVMNPGRYIHRLLDDGNGGVVDLPEEVMGMSLSMDENMALSLLLEGVLEHRRQRQQRGL